MKRKKKYVQPHCEAGTRPLWEKACANEEKKNSFSIFREQPRLDGNHGERVQERLKMALASYFNYWGNEMAELLDAYEETEQRKIVHLFMDIIAMGRWKEEGNGAVITCGVHHSIKKVLDILINLYLLDIRASQCVEMASSALKKK